MIRGGEPVARGTRIPVYMPADLIKAGVGPERILEDYPALDPQLQRRFGEDAVRSPAPVTIR